jgi:hypothetical protein
MCYLEIKLLSLPGMIFAQFKTFGDMYNVGLQLMRQAALSWSETARLMTFTFS